MKRSAGRLLMGALLAFLAIPIGGAAPLSLTAANLSAAQGSGVRAHTAADASAAAFYDETPTTQHAPFAAMPGPRPHADAAEAAPASGVGVAAGVAATTLISLGLVVALWSHAKSWMIGSAALPLFSRIAGHKILENDVRSRVHEAVSQNPGMSIKQVTETLGIGWGTAVYHLNRLEEERLIVSERHRQFRRYFRNGGGIVNDDKTAYLELKHPTTQRLAAQLLERPGAAQTELCQALGISAPLAHKYLARLEAADLLTKQRAWKTVRYFPTPRLGALLGHGAPAVPLAPA